ncbi:MAG: TIGR03936 family radical SAM-associated protein [Clostridia bacterium]|nr:TIGR03936 family radical SAM-associated protein [Clostridia bacterium]
MARFVIDYKKYGYIKYTSHLDMLRLFKRAFKRAGIELEYSNGFNPHPKMGFALPLSLGYESLCEMVEFETEQKITKEEVAERLKKIMPEGLEITGCRILPTEGKSLAALVDKASYEIILPSDFEGMAECDFAGLSENFMRQNEIIVMKLSKKDKRGRRTEKPLDIRRMLHSFEISSKGGHQVISMTADCGSNSNLSPELVIQAFLKFAKLEIPRHEIDVKRIGIEFVK